MGRLNKTFNHYTKKPSSTLILTQAELNKIKNDVRKETVDKMARYDVEVLLTCFATVLRREYGWGYKRIFRALDGVDSLFGRVLNDELSDEEMRKQLEEEVGIKINCDGGENGTKTR